MTQEQETIDDADLATCLKVFSLLKEKPELKSLAKVNEKLKELFALVKLVLYPPYEVRNEFRKKGKQFKRDQDKKVLESTLIRRLRPVLKVASPVGSETALLSQLRPPKSLTVDQIEKLDLKEEPHLLNFARVCHICRQDFKKVHHFYDQLCSSCADLNFSKREFKMNLFGKVCLVTGARIKIGFRIALKLLEMGAQVIITTRFPHDATQRYSKEPNFTKWGKNLHIYGIDFRDISMIHHFAAHIKSKFSRLDLLMNNAAQTVRKPPAFYTHLMAGESKELDPCLVQATNVTNVYKMPKGYAFIKTNCRTHMPLNSNELLEPAFPAANAIAPLASVNHSAHLSQLALIDGDDSNDTSLFPEGILDRDNQQVDLRLNNSWTLELGQISTTEMVECHVINAFAPWVLITELKELMQATEGSKYIVNVSAMEGQFYRTKTIYHPHTNMAKASLNMLTRTSAAGFADISIFMTAVDTGWITDENPSELHENRADNPPPLDEEDAAMRCLDPFLVGLSNPNGKQLWGVFLKNYFPTRW